MIGNAIAGTLSATYVAPTYTYSQLVLQDSPLGYWLLDEASGSTASDSSGNSRNGTYYNSPTLHATGPGATNLPYATTFNGSNQKVVTGDYAAFAFQPSASWSLEHWVKTSTSALSQTVTNRDATHSPSASIYLNLNAANDVGYGSGSLFDAYASAGVNDGNWHYICITAAAAGNLKVYIDGTLKKTDGTARGVLTLTTAPVTMATNGTIGVHWLNGSLCATAIYNTELSATRVALRYAAGII
jgi:hypothetical protein